jgi:flagellar protein FlaG
MLVSAISPAAPAATQPRASAAPVAPASAAGPTVDLAAVKSAVATVKEALKPVGGGLEFNVDQTNGKTIVRVVDLDTQQIIRQIPSEEMVELSRVLERLEGLLFSKHA